MGPCSRKSSAAALWGWEWLFEGVAFLRLSPLQMRLRQRWSAWRQSATRVDHGRVDLRRFDPRWNQQVDTAAAAENKKPVRYCWLMRLRPALRCAVSPLRPMRPPLLRYDPRWSDGEPLSSQSRPSCPIRVGYPAFQIPACFANAELGRPSCFLHRCQSASIISIRQRWRTSEGPSRLGLSPFDCGDQGIEPVFELLTLVRSPCGLV